MKWTRFFEKKKLLLIGVLFVVIELAALIDVWLLENPTQLFWLCYISLAIIAMGIFLHRPRLVVSQVYLLAIPLTIWTLDFIIGLVMGTSPWGITAYYFDGSAFTLGDFVSLQHLFTVPLSIYAIYLMGGLKERYAWVLSVLQVILIFVIVRLFTTPGENINCVFYPCVAIVAPLPHFVLWFLTFFGFIGASGIILHLSGILKPRKKYNNL